ncbi:MAG: hypothetical protein WAN28_22825, partial [Terracidiphilus sp.]
MSDAAQILYPERMPMNDGLEPIRSAAREAERWDVLHRPENKGQFPARVEARREALKKLEAELAQLPVSPSATEKKIPFHAELLDLRGNPRVLRTAVSAVADRPRLVAGLPRVVWEQKKKEEPRVATIAAAYLRAVDGVFSGPSLTEFLRNLQTREALTVDELWYVAPFLKFVLLEMLLDEAQVLLHAPDTVTESKVSIRIKSLRTVTNTDWVYLIEPLIIFDEALRQDPAKTYAQMNFESRELYRKRIAFVARYSDCSEPQVAQMALHLAQEAATRDGEDARMQQRRNHIGYYLVDKGFPLLANRIGYHPPFLDRVRMLVRDNNEDFYITGIQLLSILLIAVI